MPRHRQKPMNKAIDAYFKALKKKGVRIEDIANRLCVSYPTIIAYRNGYRKPKRIVKEVLELAYKIRVPEELWSQC